MELVTFWCGIFGGTLIGLLIPKITNGIRWIYNDQERVNKEYKQMKENALKYTLQNKRKN